MKVEIHQQGGTRRIIDITPGATVGGTIGKNIYNADGTLFVPSVTPSQPGASITAWNLILDIPPNVSALASVAGVGLYAVTGAGTSATRTLETDETVVVTNPDGVAGNPRISALNPYAVYIIDENGNCITDENGNYLVSDTGFPINPDFLPPARENLTATRNYYVATTGSDSNNGLTAGAPFLTIQKAVDTILALDTKGFPVIVNVADGTYTGGASATTRTIGGSSIQIIGNTTTPANVVISPASGNCINANFNALIQISGMTLVAAAGSAVASANGATVFVLGGVVFGACSNDHILADSTARVYVVASYSVTGGCTNHWHATNTGSIFASGLTITVTGTPTMVRWAGAAGGSVIGAASNAYAGSMTGAKFLVHRLAIINTEGAGISAFPGSVAGNEVTATGGYYV